MKKCIFLIFISLLSFSSCKKDKFPSTPTIITGKVIDENEIPIEGYQFQFSGKDKTNFLNSNITFDSKFETNKDGVYSTSIMVPSNTSSTTFKPIGFKLPGGNFDPLYQNIFVFIDGKYLPPYNISKIKYGVTNTYNFQVIKLKL